MQQILIYFIFHFFQKGSLHPSAELLPGDGILSERDIVQLFA